MAKAMQASHCPHCGAPWSVGATQCSGCGQALPAQAGQQTVVMAQVDAEPAGAAPAAGRAATVAMPPVMSTGGPAPAVVVGTAATANPNVETYPAQGGPVAPGGASNPNVSTEPAHLGPTNPNVSTEPAHLGPTNPNVSTEPANLNAPATEAARKKAQAMTMMAGAGFSMAETFNKAYGNPFPGWRAELAEPAGPSTGGGMQAGQPISIVAPSGDRLAIGRVEPVRRYVTLRSFDLVAAMHQQRFGRALAVSRSDYQRFLSSVQVMFSSGGLTIHHETAGPSATATGGREAGSSQLIWILLTLLVLVGMGLLIYTQVIAPG